MKIHAGCGKVFIPGFVHVDVVDYDHIDLRHSIDSLPMIPSESVELIFACHVLEHFHRRDASRVLKEWHRVLKPGGVLRVAVPDFHAVALAHVEDGVPLDRLMGLLFGRQDYLYNIHATVYDQPMLERALIAAGFSEPRLYDWRKTDHAHIDDYSQAYLPHLDRENGRLMSLNMEATKP